MDWLRSNAFGNHFHEDTALPWTIELTKENALPGTEDQLSAVYKHSLAGSSNYRLHVRISVALCVTVRPSVRNQPVEDTLKVMSHVGVGMFVDGDSSRCVRDVNVACTRVYRGFAYRLFYSVGNVYEFRAPAALYVKRFHAANL